MQQSSTSNTTTMLTTKTQVQTQQKPQRPQRTLILHLTSKPTPRVSWTQDTIDNQFMNKKKSNLCCIYHKPGQSSSDTCTSDDEGNALERDRHTKHQHKKKCSKRKIRKKIIRKKNNDKKQQCKKDSCKH